jgi:prepilin-type N-terminal cleavage/methylation domain-containing protein
MKRKLNKGFTLAELLIVVAIIGVLVAISIPIFNNQLKKARFATNVANARAAYAAAIAQYIDDGMPVKKGWICYTYNVSIGKLDSSITSPRNYGCHVRTGSVGESLTDISDWKPTSFANQDDRTLGSDVYKYWQNSWGCHHQEGDHFRCAHL